MKINKVTGVYFSPNGSTKKMVNYLVHSLNIDPVEELDLTMVKSRQIQRTFTQEELLVVGFPVYADRLPVTSEEVFKRLKGNSTPAIAIVSYGNRDYGDALLELRDRLKSSNFKVISAAAIIGEHCQNPSVAPGRPDEMDLREIEKYGELIQEKLSSLEELEKADQVYVPGQVPYRPRKDHLTPQGDDKCIQCGEYFHHCPVNAISAQNYSITDPDLCIFCAKCIQICPTHVRDMKQESYLAFMEKLEVVAKERKEMETFF